MSLTDPTLVIVLEIFSRQLWRAECKRRRSFFRNAIILGKIPPRCAAPGARLPGPWDESRANGSEKQGKDRPSSLAPDDIAEIGMRWALPVTSRTTRSAVCLIKALGYPGVSFMFKELRLHEMRWSSARFRAVATSESRQAFAHIGETYTASAPTSLLSHSSFYLTFLLACFRRAGSWRISLRA